MNILTNQSKAALKLIGALILVALIIEFISVVKPKFQRTYDPKVLNIQLDYKIPNNAHILDAGRIDRFGVFPRHALFAVFILDKNSLSSFLSQPSITPYSPSNAKVGKKRMADAPESLGFSSNVWDVKNVIHFKVYHYSGQAGDILIDLDDSQSAKVYVFTDS